MSGRTIEDTMKMVRKDKETFKELLNKNWGHVRGIDGGSITVRWGLTDHFKKHKLVEFRVKPRFGKEEVRIVVPVEELEHYLRMA